MASETAPEANRKKSAVYEAGCHCGHIGFSVTMTPPLDEQEVLECNCSICRRMGYLLVCESDAACELPRR